MAKNRGSDQHDRAAGGMDFDEPFRERAAEFGSTLVSSGPDALFEQVEELLPESWRAHIQAFPLAAVAVGVGVGVFLGMKKGEELLAAGSSLIAAAATANLNQFLQQRAGAGSSEED